jgi:hypothetical protein
VGRDQKDFLIRVPMAADDTESRTQKVATTLKNSFGADQVDVLRVEAVGPRVGQALRGRAIWAVLASTLMMGIYIWARFEWRYGLGAVIALAHDVIMTVGFLIAFGYEFDLTIVAALLTVVGFSVNDTVIVSDRIRENRRKDRRHVARRADQCERQRDPEPDDPHLRHGDPGDPVVVPARRTGDPRLRLRAARRLHGRHVLLDLHRRAGGPVLRAGAASAPVSRGGRESAPAARRT